jgi:AcrR family transcriptional regulator
VSGTVNPVGRPFRGVPSDERQAQRRRQIVEAGLDAFGTRGFHSTGVRDVCATARLTERYFYESFRNLEALFLAVYEEAVERMRTVVTLALEGVGDRPTEIARAGLIATLSTYRKDPRLARILLVEALAIGREVGDAQQAVSASFAEMIARVTQGLFPGMADHGLEPRLVGNALYGATLYVSMQWVSGGFREPQEQILAHCLLVFDALFAEMTRRERSRSRAPAKPRNAKANAKVNAKANAKTNGARRRPE